MNNEKTCPGCNHVVKSTWKICPYCKQRLLETSSRDNGVEFPKNDYEGPLNAIDYSRRSTKSSGCMRFGIAACVIFILIIIVAVAMSGNDSYYGDLNLNDSAEIPEDDFVRDSRDGKVYRTVEIQGQTWMAQNLNFATSSGSYCYNNDANSCNTYGRLYTWDAAKKACPYGWRLPDDFDWRNLHLEDSFAGYNLKAESMQGNDAFGFTVLPAGFREKEGRYDHLGLSAFFWSSTSNGNTATRWNFYHDSMGMQKMSISKKYGFSVRCVKN